MKTTLHCQDGTTYTITLIGSYDDIESKFLGKYLFGKRVIRIKYK